MLGIGPHSSSIFYLFLSLFSWPNLSGRRLDVYHSSTHGVAIVRIYNAGMKCAASHWKYRLTCAVIGRLFHVIYAIRQQYSADISARLDIG